MNSEKGKKCFVWEQMVFHTHHLEFGTSGAQITLLFMEMWKSPNLSSVCKTSTVSSASSILFRSFSGASKKNPQIKNWWIDGTCRCDCLVLVCFGLIQFILFGRHHPILSSFLLLLIVLLFQPNPTSFNWSPESKCQILSRHPQSEPITYWKVSDVYCDPFEKMFYKR